MVYNLRVYFMVNQEAETMPNQPKEFWDTRAQTYDSDSGKIYAETNDKTARRSLQYLKPTDRVLEFACGTGLITFRMAPRVSHIRGIDISPKMVDAALKKAQEQGAANVEITNTDLFDPCLEPGSFDAVAAFNVLLYLPDLPAALARIRELLKPGGMFLSATDCLGSRPSAVGLKKLVKSHTGSMPYVAFFTQRGLARRIAQNGFTVLERENLFPNPPNLFVAARKA